MPRKYSLLLWALIALTIATLEGCGFHLREAVELPPSLSPLRIHGLGEFDPLRNDLREILTEANVQVTDNPTGASASSILQIHKQNRERRVLSVDEGGKVVEYEIHYGLQFDLVDDNGAQLVKKQGVGVQRAYVNPDTGILGKEQEEVLMRRDMRLELARRIVGRLQETVKSHKLQVTSSK